MLNEKGNKLNDGVYVKEGKFLILLFTIYFLLSNFEAYINVLVGPITKYYILFFIIVLFTKYEFVKIRYQHIILATWLGFKLISVFWIQDTLIGTSIIKTHFLSQLGMVGLFIILTIATFNTKAVNSIIHTAMYSSGALGILALFFSTPYHGTYDYRLTLTILNVQLDPNDLAALYLLGFTISLYFILYEKKYNLLYFVIVIANAIAMGLTGSRGGFVSLLLIVLVYIVMGRGANKGIQLFKKTIFFITFLSLLYIMANNLLPSGTLERLFDFKSYEGGSARSTLWEVTINYFKEKPIFGYGWGAVNLRTHNTYLTALIDTGLIGLGLLIGFIVLIVIKAIKMQQPLVIALLIAGLAPSFFLDAINKRYFWNAIILAGIVINNPSLINIVKVKKDELLKKGD